MSGDEACPGCGSMPGDGRTPGCKHPDGCGFADVTKQRLLITLVFEVVPNEPLTDDEIANLKHADVETVLESFNLASPEFGTVNAAVKVTAVVGVTPIYEGD